MDIVVDIRAKFVRDEFEFSRHAVDQTILRSITVREIREAIQASELLEDDPNGKYGPCCLLLGFTRAGRALRVQCSYPSRLLVKVITAYEPGLDEWDSYRVRRK